MAKRDGSGPARRQEALTEPIKVLLEKMKSDAAFRTSVLNIEDLDARMDFLQKEGYDCKVGDIQLYLHDCLAKEGNQVVFLTELGGCNKIWYGFCF